MNFD